MKHMCHAYDCKTQVPPRLFMCIKHWRMVPKLAQGEIWSNYREGQEVRKDPTSEYIKAAQRAQILVLMAERKLELREAATLVLATYGVTE